MKHLWISRNNRLVFLHVSSPFYILWGGWACFICMKAVGWACLSADYFCLWVRIIVEWVGGFLYTGKHAKLRGGYAGIFLHKFGVSCQIRICDVTAKMLLVRGKAPETPDNVKWRQILPSLLIYDGIICRHFWDLTALFAVMIFDILWMTAFSAVTFLNLTALFDGIFEECRRFLPSYF